MMIYLVGGAIVAVVALGCVCTAAGRFAVKRSTALGLSRLLALIACLGVIGTAVTSAVFYTAAAGGAGDALRDAYTLFFTVDTVLVLVCVVITAISALSGGKMRTVRSLLAFLWAIVSLMWTALCMVWSDYDLLNASVYIGICGISLAGTLCLAGAIDMLKLARQLSTAEGAAERKAEIHARGEGRRRRKRIREKKKQTASKH